jgi:hypothetical protein
MIRENFRKAKETIRFALHTLLRDDYGGHGYPKGEVFWEVRDSRTGRVTESGKLNVVTLDASILIARLMKGTGAAIPHQSEPSFGVFALAVGTGDISWNPLNPPAATNTQRSLFNELARKQIATTNFINQSGGISGVPTNVVDFNTTFAESEAVGVLTEMGLLGGDVNTNMSITNPVLPPNGTYDPTVNLVGLDTLVNYVTFPAISKPPTSTLSWTWRLTF